MKKKTERKCIKINMNEYLRIPANSKFRKRDTQHDVAGKQDVGCLNNFSVQANTGTHIFIFCHLHTKYFRWKNMSIFCTQLVATFPSLPHIINSVEMTSVVFFCRSNRRSHVGKTVSQSWDSTIQQIFAQRNSSIFQMPA